LIIFSPSRRKPMIALVLELCGGVCAFSTIAFLALASVSKLRPDLEEELDADRWAIEKTAEARERKAANLKIGPMGSPEPIGEDMGRTRDRAAENSASLRRRSSARF
jgi:hypothetical protein